MILGIDTSCDETSIALLERDSGRVAVNLIASQIDLHAPHGGVVPELASRAHAESLAPLFEEALRRANASLHDITTIAVTNTPGLIGCLLVGTSFAKALAYRLNVPLVAINHLEAHLFSPFIGGEPVFPFLGLVVSGGHTAFYRVASWDDVTLVGQTVDDAAGEAFDKTAKLMGLGYPGGPVVDKLAQDGDALAFAFAEPKVKMGAQYLSFSGIKTAVRYHIEKLPALDEVVRRNLCASLRHAIVSHLSRKAAYFLEQGGYSCLALSGGVAMNALLRANFKTLAAERSVTAAIVAPEYGADNAAMVAYLARHRPAVSDVCSLSTLPSKKIQARELKQCGVVSREET